jgi:hypothetical protein
MKDLSSTIGRLVEPLYGIEPTRYYATPPISRRIEELTWDEIDNTVSELYYDIRETTSEQLEHEKDHKR